MHTQVTCPKPRVISPCPDTQAVLDHSPLLPYFGQGPSWCAQDAGKAPKSTLPHPPGHWTISLLIFPLNLLCSWPPLTSRPQLSPNAVDAVAADAHPPRPGALCPSPLTFRACSCRCRICSAMTVSLLQAFARTKLSAWERKSGLLRTRSSPLDCAEPAVVEIKTSTELGGAGTVLAPRAGARTSSCLHRIRGSEREQQDILRSNGLD